MRPSAADDQGNDGTWHRLWRKGNGKGWLKRVVHDLCQDHPLAISADFLIPIVLLLLIQGDGLRSSLLGRYFGTNYHIRIGRDANSKSLIDSNSKKTASQMVNSGPGAEMLSRAGVTLCEMQGRLDKCGASDLIIDLIMVQPNLRVFLEILELAIALLEGGNNSIQVGNYLDSQEFLWFWTGGNNSIQVGNYLDSQEFLWFWTRERRRARPRYNAPVAHARAVRAWSASFSTCIFLFSRVLQEPALFITSNHFSHISLFFSFEEIIAPSVYKR